MPVQVVQMREDIKGAVNVCSNGTGRVLSPFLLGPVKLYNGFVSNCVENAWQYCKVYPEFAIKLKGLGICISPKYFKWAIAGWGSKTAKRYPLGKGRKPLFSLWNKKRYNYIEARKQIYIPLYAKTVVKTEVFKELKRQYAKTNHLCLKDFDGYDYLKMGMSLYDVLHEEKRIMGHAHVLAMILENKVVVKGDKVKVFDYIVK